MRSRLEVAALVIALLAVIGFAVSFAIGLRGEPKPVTITAETMTMPEPPLSTNNERRVEVINSSRKNGLARQATERLRDAGYDVVNFGSGNLDEPTSVVFDRVGKPAIAKGIADALGITRVETRRDSSRLVEASVILASDWPPPSHTQTRTRWTDRLPAWIVPGR